ncbi:hypothetical protein BCR41DRAFT_371206 [Lobosporangium transversale]|uniref:RRM domain-containing protein n=1 Tax=Lobosporangium transversale TaxID=64571 RepID=A0A1Y2GLD3_9FUNG|nr:hypothetical protein BCR41DRAFT_371206 [Lobosporangium transversale]ORZ14379.1 hypothetical protein BCR41DRAFT_371206 [Lobosporangium transversale]|eukprot:XP_021880857.1 hypothetical protein BCR41DRAFT_371206 [Lobosporangium transversale]
MLLLQFEKYGRVLSVELKHGGFAFVEYEDPRDADDAVVIIAEGLPRLLATAEGALQDRMEGTHMTMDIVDVAIRDHPTGGTAIALAPLIILEAIVADLPRLITVIADGVVRRAHMGKLPLHYSHLTIPDQAPLI